MIGIRRSIWSVLVLVTIAGCDTHEQQDEFARDASRPAAGFTRTDDEGEAVSADEDDWRTAPVYVGKLRVEHARPNPATAEGFITIPLQVTAFESVIAPLRVEAFDAADLRRLIQLDQIDQAGDPGSYIFHFSAGAFGARGLHRVYIFDGVGEIVSYGDVMVE